MILQLLFGLKAAQIVHIYRPAQNPGIRESASQAHYMKCPLSGTFLLVYFFKIITDLDIAFFQ